MSQSWRIAFAKQGRSDLIAREQMLRSRPALPQCHQLHFLQMACEKICKAYLIKSGADPFSLQQSHAYIAGTLPIVIRETHAKRSKAPLEGWVFDAIRKLARQIELLAPSVDAGGLIPANCEYPWTGPAGIVLVPAEHDFELRLLSNPTMIRLLKLLPIAAESLARSTDT